MLFFFFLSGILYRMPHWNLSCILRLNLLWLHTYVFVCSLYFDIRVWTCPPLVHVFETWFLVYWFSVILWNFRGGNSWEVLQPVKMLSSEIKIVLMELLSLPFKGIITKALTLLHSVSPISSLGFLFSDFFSSFQKWFQHCLSPWGDAALESSSWNLHNAF